MASRLQGNTYKEVNINMEIYTKDSYVTGSMCDGKLKLSVLAADEIVENAVTELMGDLGIDGIVAMERYKAMWLIAKNNICFIRRPEWREDCTPDYHNFRNGIMILLKEYSGIKIKYSVKG